MSATDSFITLKSKCGILPADLNVILLKQDLSDVQFVVTDEDGGTKSFDAHKLVLAVASDVLRTMFYGSVPQTSPVQIPDSSPAAFEAFLRFIYTGAAVITEAEVFRMLYLAKKYLVSTLKEAVMSYLESRIKPDNVGQIILHGQDYLEDAPDRFWEGVERNAESLLQSSEFTLLRQDTLAVLLRRSLEADELLIYDKVVAWSEAECVR
ncbi:BTB/POZ domain-containing protein 3 [Aphelenchoides avenae]|nr:BTB/POZ domain-containing protein 3 [Aphelenchus avenae]